MGYIDSDLLIAELDKRIAAIENTSTDRGGGQFWELTQFKNWVIANCQPENNTLQTLVGEIYIRRNLIVGRADYSDGSRDAYQGLLDFVDTLL